MIKGKSESMPSIDMGEGGVGVMGTGSSSWSQVVNGFLDYFLCP